MFLLLTLSRYWLAGLTPNRRGVVIDFKLVISPTFRASDFIISYSNMFRSIFCVKLIARTMRVHFRKYKMFIRVLIGSRYLRMDQVTFLKAVFHEFYLVHSWIPQLKLAKLFSGKGGYSSPVSQSERWNESISRAGKVRMFLSNYFNYGSIHLVRTQNFPETNISYSTKRSHILKQTCSWELGVRNVFVKFWMITINGWLLS